ncbi:hypothetical protein R3P38DRAFT_1167205 [Favolaschia claudopus]|uniref:BTB domain-containing protein n=1 Tax=Favolaschia claudopus TaxID=2862362 RepID=A0AAW0DZ07_9AGAR
MDDFSTNRHNEIQQSIQTNPTGVPARHPDLSFSDGNIAILAGSVYFLVHKGLLCRHSVPLQQATKALEPARAKQLEGRPILHADCTPEAMYHFLSALYDGILDVKIDPHNFSAIDAILRLATNYQVKHIRASLLRELQRMQWPARLSQWEVREAEATDANGQYDARLHYAHPILMINLARAIQAPELLPSAFYDLSRCPVSETTAGYTDFESIVHHLSQEDLMNLLKGREHASRFLSTFVVNELEGRAPSANCGHGGNEDVGQRRTCQAAFESITFEILRDVNGITHRNSDPLFAIVDAELMQTRDDAHSVLRACEYCRTEFGVAVDHAREEFWSKLPSWFGVDLEDGVW